MGIDVLRKWQDILKREKNPVLAGRRSRRFGIKSFGLLLAGSLWCGYALGATTTVTLSPGSTTLLANTSYSITTAGEYTVTTEKKYVEGTSLTVSLPGEGSDVVLILDSCRLRPSGTPVLTVTGTGTLRLQMATGTSNAFEVITNDDVAISLTGQSVLSVEGSGTLRVRGRSCSQDTQSATIKGSSSSQIIVSGSTLRIAGSFTNTNEQSPLVQGCSFLITGGTVECIGFQTESGSAPSSYTESELFAVEAFTMTGGTLTVSSQTDAINTVACSEAQKAVLQAQVSGGVAFGKRFYTVSSASTIIPDACLKLATGASLFDEERTTDEQGRLVFDSGTNVQWKFVGEQDEAAAEVFRITPVPTDQGMTTDYDFGIARVAPGTGATDLKDNLVIITAAMRLPESAGTSSRIFFIAVDRKRNGTTDRVFGIAPVRFDYDTSSKTFRAEITTSSTMGTGTSTTTSIFSVKAFSSASE